MFDSVLTKRTQVRIESRLLIIRAGYSVNLICAAGCAREYYPIIYLSHVVHVPCLEYA